MRDWDKRNYLAAFIITVAIFSIGLLIGILIEGQRVSFIKSEYDQQKTDFQSSQIQYDLINFLTEQNQSCAAIYKTFYTSLKSLESTRIRLEDSYSKNSLISESEFQTLEREYLLSEVNYWLLAEKTKKLCNNDVITVLYFYSDAKECSDCEQQAFVLTYLKKLFDDRLLIFSFNAQNKDEPVVPLLVGTYGVSNFPTLVVEDSTFTGFTSREKLLDAICSRYRQKPQGCP